jgi:hypothetical protein
MHSFNEGQIRESVERNRSRLRQQFGDFEIVGVDYNWETLQHINTVRCVHCGQEKNVVNLSAFVRGKGEGRLCKCRKQKRHTQEKQRELQESKYTKYVGETLNGFRLLEYKTGRGFRTECVECGKQKWANAKQLLEGHVECNHKITAVYDDSLIGQKFGHLTAIEHIGRHFKFQCDCGSVKTLLPTDVCRGVITTCGRSECEYHNERGVNSDALKAREEGFAFEERFASVFENAGYKVVKTTDTGDFGVDVIVEIKGEKWAFQCKKKKVPAGVRAVAEVYAGGRFYDCTRFCVASPSGFTYPAKQMAAKLGVQLEVDKFHLNVSKEENAVELLPTTLTKFEHSKKVMWEIDGVVKPAEQWCKEYGISRTTVVSRVKEGMDLKAALAHKNKKRITIEINGVVKTKLEWCEEYGITPQLYDYRVKYTGLSPLEALTKEVSRRA